MGRGDYKLGQGWTHYYSVYSCNDKMDLITQLLINLSQLKPPKHHIL